MLYYQSLKNYYSSYINIRPIFFECGIQDLPVFTSKRYAILVEVVGRN